MSDPVENPEIDFLARRLKESCADDSVVRPAKQTRVSDAIGRIIFLNLPSQPILKHQTYIHYMSVQYTAIFHSCKNDNFQMIFFLYFSYFCS